MAFVTEVAGNGIIITASFVFVKFQRIGDKRGIRVRVRAPIWVRVQKQKQARRSHSVSDVHVSYGEGHVYRPSHNPNPRRTSAHLGRATQLQDFQQLLSYVSLVALVVAVN